MRCNWVLRFGVSTFTSFAGLSRQRFCFLSGALFHYSKRWVSTFTAV